MTTKRNGTIWPKVLLGMVGAAAAIWLLITSLGASATGAWQAYAASIRAKGQPLTFAEIESRRAIIPEEVNSARVVEALAPALAEHRGGAITLDSMMSGSKESGDFFTGIKRERLEPAREFLSKHEDILAKLNELRGKPVGRFAIQYNQANPVQTLLPHAGHIRAASKLLRLSTRIHLVDSDLSAATHDFELQCRLAGTLHDEPMLISRLVQVATQAQAVQTAEEILRVGNVDAAELESMMGALRRMQQSATLKWSLLGERAFFSESCEALIAGRMPLMDVAANVQDQNTLFFTQPLRRLPAFLGRSNQLRGVQMYTSLIDAADDPKALLAAAKKIEQELPNLSRTQILVKILMPSMSRAVILNMKISAQLDCAIAALAAERFRLAEGRLPSTLEQLVPAYLPAVPTDPFDGKPLRMAKSDQGIVIYSVDEDQVDDGGLVSLVPNDKSRKRAPDVGFRLNDLDHRGVLIIDDPAPSDE